MPTDVTDPEQVRALASAALDRYGPRLRADREHQLYADHEGGRRAITRFSVLPVDHTPGGEDDKDGGPGWLAATSRHWSLDRPDPR